MKKYLNVMIDTETLSRRLSAAIIQIAAKPFNMDGSRATTKDGDPLQNLRRQVVEAMDNVALAAAMQDESGLRSEITREMNERLHDLQMVCTILGCTSKELVELAISGRVGYIEEQQDRPLTELAKLPTPFAPRPFVMPTGGRKWYKQFDNKKHKK